MIKFTVPLRVQVSKRKKWPLNINEYRNTHHTVLNKAKKMVENIVIEQIRGQKPLRSPVKVTFTLSAGSERRLDVSNVCSIVDKYATDAVVKAKIIPDDDFKNLIEINYLFGGIDRNNPRCDVVVSEIKK